MEQSRRMGRQRRRERRITKSKKMLTVPSLARGRGARGKDAKRRRKANGRLS